MPSLHLFRHLISSVIALTLTFGISSRLLAKPVRVVVNASADEEYLEKTKNKLYQTYHFAKGKYHGGTKRDLKLENMTFMEVAETTAGYLARARFYPAKTKDVGDLLILVSWGTTRLDVDMTEVMGITDLGNNNFGDVGTPQSITPPGGQESAAGAQTESFDASAYTAGPQSLGAYHMSINKTMLGFNKGLYGDGLSKIEREKLNHELFEERYFIVLNAFDLPHLREHKELKEVWSTRYSTRNIGTNFTKALDFMNLAAAPTFGKNLDTLQIPRVDPDSNVIIGEIEVLGTESSNDAMNK